MEQEPRPSEESELALNDGPSDDRGTATKTGEADSLNLDSGGSMSKIDTLIEISRKILQTLERRPELATNDVENQTFHGKENGLKTAPTQPAIWQNPKFEELAKDRELFDMNKLLPPYSQQRLHDFTWLDKEIEQAKASSRDGSSPNFTQIVQLCKQLKSDGEELLYEVDDDEKEWFVERIVWLLTESFKLDPNERRRMALEKIGDPEYPLERLGTYDTTDSIFLKLHAYFRFTIARIELSPSYDGKQIRRVIVSCILAIFNWTPDNGTHSQEPIPVGEVLLQCYHDGSLQSPENSGGDTQPWINESHITIVGDAFGALNCTNANGQFNYFFAKDQNPLELLSCSPQSLFFLKSSRMETKINTPEELYDRDAAKDFQTVDLNVGKLMEIANLTIRWDFFHENHLVLDKEANVLRVAWFSIPPGGWTAYRYQHVAKTPDDGKDALRFKTMATEIYRTWAILFAGKDVGKKRQLYYRALRSSPFSIFRSEALKNRHKRSILWGWRGRHSWTDHAFRETALHLGEIPYLGMSSYDWNQKRFVQNLAKNPVLSYADFPIYGERLRVLRAYIDNRPPLTLRQLRKDKRNTLGYWTLWAAVIAGSLTVFLALSTLMISIAQTVAAYKVLDLPPSRRGGSASG